MFNIPLMGEGSGSVEALPSYLHRCAYHHGVPTTKFLEYLNREYGRVFSLQNKSFKASHNITSNGLLTYSTYARRYVDVIERLTGKNLFYTTFFSLREFIAQPRKEIHNHVRWCPECFKAIRNIGCEPYIKLIWYFSELSHCPHHCTPLLDTCPQCGAYQDAIGRKKPLDFCHYCSGDLKIRDNKRKIELKPSWILQAGDLLRLIAQIAYRQDNVYFSNGCFQKKGLDKSFSDFAICCTEPEFIQAYEYCRRNHKTMGGIWYGGIWNEFYSDRISLRALRIFAHITNVDIFDVLTGRLMKKTKSMRYLWNQKLPLSLEYVKKRKINDHAENFERLNELANINPPISLKEVVRRTNMSTGYVSYRFPILKQKIVGRYRQYLENCSIEKCLKAKAMALRYFIGRDYVDYPKSRKQALKTLLNDTSLTKMYLQSAIKQAYEIYQNKK